MNIIKQVITNGILVTGLLCLVHQFATGQHHRHHKAGPVKNSQPTQLQSFLKEADDAGVDFTLPASFKGIPVVNNENFSFDYAMAMPGQDFEVWLQVHSLKQNWASYEQVKNITGKMLANPDSTYINTVKAHARAMTDDGRYLIRSLSPQVLQLYNADAGKTCLFSVADLPETKHYKYALLIALQKDHTGYVMAVCFTNEKGPEFFKNINKARDCIKFR